MSIPKAALCASLFLLTSCETLSSPDKPPPSQCTEVRQTPVLPAGAGAVAPVTEAEKLAFRLLLTWMAEVVSVSDENAARAETAREGC